MASSPQTQLFKTFFGCLRHELESKLPKRSCIKDYIGDYYRAYRGLDYGSHGFEKP